MSNFTELAILVALVIAAAVVYVLMDRLIQNHYDAAETGITRGVPMSVQYRRLLLTTRLVPAIGTTANHGRISGISGQIAGVRHCRWARRKKARYWKKPAGPITK
jgi:hypothetical protein